MSLKSLINQLREIIVFPKNVLRFFNLININYNLDGKINFGCKKTNTFFLRNLKHCKFYFEYGSGNSTIIAHKLKKIYLSAESDKNFSLYLKEKLRLNILENNFGLVKFYSRPLFEKIRKNELKNKSLKYAKSIKTFIRKYKFPDLILIDGRCRVLCAIMIHKELDNYKKKKFLIILDDYKNRDHYSIINKFFYVKKLGRFAVIRKRKEININKYVNIFANDFR